MSEDPNLSCPYCGTHELYPLGKLQDSHCFAGKHLPEVIPGGTLYRCHQCQLKFRYPVHDKTVYQQLYDNAAISTWPINAARPDWDLIICHILQHLPQGGRVLDFGCYTGGLLARLDGAYERHGVEINRAAATIAADRVRAQMWPSADDIPGKLRFDVIVVSDVIEHISNPGHLLDGLLALLADGGILIITTGDAENYLWNRFGANWWYCFYPEHITFLSEAWISCFSHDRDLSIKRCQRFRYYRHSTSRRLVEAAFTYFYGFFPSVYLRLSNTLRDMLTRPNATSVPGNGVSDDHLFIVLARKEMH